MQTSPIIRFHGAAGTVTGSCFRLEANGRQILVDCGMFQGSKTEKQLNYRPFPFDPHKIDCVVLTHAHIDHSGLLPKLVRMGFDGPIHATPATVDLCSVMLPDSAHIQEIEVDQLNRRNRRRGRDAVEAIYTAEDAEATLTQFRPLPLGEWRELGGEIRVRLWNAGHLLGSASVEMEIGGGAPMRLLFSGDIGPSHKLLEDDPEAPSSWDYVICESTYGDRERIDASEEARRAALREAVTAAARHRDGALIIPSFAVERTQELLADLVLLADRNEIPTCPIIIDSPLATRATEIFSAHAGELDHGDLLLRALRSHSVRFTESVEQSKAVDFIHGFHIVIAASGMCEAGRIRHRLKNWLWREEGTVLLVGYQAAGTLGRILQEGAGTVRIQGEEITVRASIRSIDAYSGHADGVELSKWLDGRRPVRKGLFLVHGEEGAIAGMKARAGSVVDPSIIHAPRIDGAFRLEETGPVDLSPALAEPRLDPIQVGHRDWNNDFQVLLQDLQAQLRLAADDKARAVILRKIRRALET